MKKALSILLTISLLGALNSPIYSEDLESTNYKIVGPTTTGGGITESTNFAVLSTIGDFSGDPRISTSNYRLNTGVEIYTASVPKVACFETTTDGSSSCTTGPAYLNSGGMTTVCGPQGCYNSARVEIDEQSNPADTLYSIQISSDNFATETLYIDGQINKPKPRSAIDIADFKTKTDWETDNTNIKGLDANTQYWVQITALHGDFTESEPGPTASATTALAIMDFDLDIADSSGTAAESSSPYNIYFQNTSKLVVTGPPRGAEDLIWIDGQTNGNGGFAILQGGIYGGLNSTTETYTITSASVNLDSVTEGFGLQSFYTAQSKESGSGNGDLGAISTIAAYAGSNNTVGIISTSQVKIYESDGPTLSGRMGIRLKARASASTPPATDYTEKITVVMVPRY